MTTISSVLIIGLGLIGGSLAKRIKRYHPTVTLHGIAPSKNTINLASKSNLFESVHQTIQAAPKQIDCVFVCTPIHLIVDIIHAVSNHIESDCIITDVASVKKNIVERVKLSKQNHIFIPGHPMAGTEHTGFSASTEALFNDTSYILIKTKQDTPHFKEFLKTLDVSLVETDADTHDKMIALASHLPYVITTLIISLVSTLSKDDQALFQSILGPGFKDTTRVSASSPDWGLDVCRHNIDHIDTLLTSFEKAITTFKDKLNTDTETLKPFFEEMKSLKKHLH